MNKKEAWELIPDFLSLILKIRGIGAGVRIVFVPRLEPLELNF